MDLAPTPELRLSLENIMKTTDDLPLVPISSAALSTIVSPVVTVSNPYAKKRPKGQGSPPPPPPRPTSSFAAALPVRVSQPTPGSEKRMGLMSQDLADPTDSTSYDPMTKSAASAGGGVVGGLKKTSCKRTSSEALRPNPYARKSHKSSVGTGPGKHPARAKAPASRILNPEERRMLLEPLAPTMPVFDRFFCALLRSSPAEYRSALSSDDKASGLWRAICQRVSVPVPDVPLPSRYPLVDSGDSGDDFGGARSGADLHFDHRAALVLEEARQAISQGLACPPALAGRGVGAKSSSAAASMVVSVHNVETTHTMGTVKVTFAKRSDKFTPDELSLLRPGNVVELTSRDFFSRSDTSSVLAVLASTNRELIERTRQFQCLVFEPSVCVKQGQDWKMQVVTSGISECRCFEAMTSATIRKSGLVPSLLGYQQRDELLVSDESPAATKGTKSIASFFSHQASDLNETQELASRTFLESEPNSITLIQGPPGTGKTTLLVTIIRRYVQQPKEDSFDRRMPRRLLVCAPTNKAIVVLASRFLKANANSATNCVVVGDADKLLENGRASPLRRIFLFSWMQVVIEEYRKLRNAFLPGSRDPSMKALQKTAQRLQTQLSRNLSAKDGKEMNAATNKVCDMLRSFVLGQDASAIVSRIESLLKLLGNIPIDLVHKQVLDKAEIIFCTLTCSGGAVFKNKQPVDDLIVDEAAAATEPEVCIPLHLKPSRVLLVGDPLQLPATILSRKAATLGLAKSLQERLMLECRYPHIMLNLQYRMKPQIAHFPSSRFYESRLLNGSNVEDPSYGIRGRHNDSSRVLLGGRPYVFLQVAGVEEQGAGGSFRNPAEAQVVVDLLTQLRDDRDKDWMSDNRIRVITYYQAQVALLKRLFRQHNLTDVVVATVDSSQGCESDIVLVSLVRSRASKVAAGTVGFLADDRRMNVSLTRARYQLVCIGNARQLQTCSSETIRQLAIDADERDCVLPYPSPHTENQSGEGAPLSNSLDLFYGDRKLATKYL